MLKEYRLPNNAPDAPGQLYNLDFDPGETTNLMLQRPEIASNLQALLEQTLKSGRSRP